MPRPKIQISQVDLENTIYQLESVSEFRNLKGLYDAVSGSPFGQALNGSLNYGVFYQRLREFGLLDKIKTKSKKGNDGSYLAAARASRKPRVSRREKLEAHADTFNILQERYPTKSSAIERAKGGSLKALIALKCLDCCGGQTAEIRACTATGCSLYPVRPGANHKSSPFLRGNS